MSSPYQAPNPYFLNPSIPPGGYTSLSSFAPSAASYGIPLEAGGSVYGMPSNLGAAASGVAGAAEGAAGAAGGISGLSQFAPRLAAQAAAHPMIARALPLLAAQAITSQDFVPGHGNLEAAGRGAITGAAAGAAIGAPLFGIGAVPGAAIGGLIGGVGSLALNTLFGEGKSPDYKTQLATAASQLGLDPNQYSVAYDLLSKSGADPKTLSGQLAAQLLQDASIKKQTDQATAIQAQQHTSDQQYALAMQSQIQQFLSPYTNNILTDGLAQAESLKAHAANLPPAYASVLQAQAAEAVSSSQRLASAYAGQAVALPNQYMMNADLKRQTELATLRYQQAVVNAQAGKGGGGFAQALAAQTPTGG